MNYITRLQGELAEAKAAAIAVNERLAELRQHLASPKFGPQADGERGDWISVADVQRWLTYIEQR
jgi:hypothetical protein